MLLLYCNKTTATVVATHDDSMAAVPISAYGGNSATMRIVPWSQPLSALTRSGPAPPTDPNTGYPAVDSRPYAQPTETTAILLAYAAQLRYQVSTEVLNVTVSNGTIPVNTDRLSQSLLNNLATYAATLAPTTAINFTQNNVSYTIQAEDATTIFNAVLAQIQSARDIEAQCIADLNSTTPTIKTYADVEARFA